MPANLLPRLNSIGFWSAGGAQDWGEDPHRNEGVEIVYLETGSMVLTLGEKSFELAAGDFTVTRPWQLHKFGAPNIGPGRLHWFIIDVGVRRPQQNWVWPDWVALTKPDRAELTRRLRRSETPVWKGNSAMAHSFRELADVIVDWNKPRAVSRLVIALNRALLGVLDALSTQPGRPAPRLASNRRKVELFLRDLEQGRIDVSEPWTLERMAERCGMGVTAFSQYTREIANVGPIEFLNRRRLDLAMQKLKTNGSRTITEIAFACGFNSSQYFATCFRRRFHAPPSRFMRES